MKQLLGLAVVAWAGVSLAATTAEIDAAIGRGVEFLKSQQAADGHFSDANTPALTALPLWVLTAVGQGGEDSARRAAEFVLKCQQEDGGFYAKRPPRPEGKPGAGGDKRPGPRPEGKGEGKAGGSGGPGGLSTYNTSVCLTALYEWGKAPQAAILKARRFLAESQLDGEDTMAGGFGYGRGGARRYADLSNTAYAMDAMRRTEKVEEFRAAGEARADLDWEAALKFVTSLQAADGPEQGGAAYNERTPQAGATTNSAGRVRLMAYGSMSYAAVMSMAHAKLTKSDPRVRNALGYCARYWTVNENPGMGSQGLYYYYDILSRALAAAELTELEREDGRKIDWRRELADQLVKLQRENGAWKNDNNRFWEGDEVLATSFAVLALTLCK